jgi:hypothetical protein
MAQLIWDQVGDRQFEVGVSKAVFYKSDRYGIVWNGITSVDDTVETSVEPLYFDGMKFNDIVTIGDTKATLRAFTYPDEFLEYEGTIEDVPGFFVLNQEPKRFSLCYRTEVGNDVNGQAGYKIHILYNLTAVPTDKGYETINEDLSPIEFEWELTAIPEQIGNFRPTAHVILDSRRLDPYLLRDIEAIIYGSEDDEGNNFVVSNNGNKTFTAVATDLDTIVVDEETGIFTIKTVYAEYLDEAETVYTLISAPNRDAFLPSLRGLSSFIDKWSRFVVNDNGDGTWTAYSVEEGVIVMLDDDTFQITTDTAAYVDAEETKYTITSSQKSQDDLTL